MFAVHGISAQRGGVDECSGEEDVFAMVGSILILPQYLIVKKLDVVWFRRNQCLAACCVLQYFDSKILRTNGLFSDWSELPERQAAWTRGWLGLRVQRRLEISPGFRSLVRKKKKRKEKWSFGKIQRYKEEIKRSHEGEWQRQWVNEMWPSGGKLI